jgi:5'-nucleotidase
MNDWNILAVSEGFTMTLDPSKPAGQRVVAAALNGKPIDPAASYRVTLNNFIAAGGDGFVTFQQGRDPQVGPLDLDSMEAYLRDKDIVQVPPVGRVTIIGR